MNANFTIRVLLIEDEPSDAGIVRQMLRCAPVGHFDVDWAVSLKEAHKVILHHHSDVILADLSLPDSSGLDTVRALRHMVLHTNIPIIVQTGNDDTALALRALEAGAQDYIIKGVFTSDSLIRAIYYAKTRAQLEARLSEQQQRFLLLAKHVPGCIYQFHLRKDGTTHAPFVSAGLRELCGLEPSDIVDDATPFVERIHPVDRDNFLLSVRCSAKTLFPWSMEFRFHHKQTDTFIWLRGESTPVLQADDSVQWYGHLMGISELKETEQILLDYNHTLSRQVEEEVNKRNLTNALYKNLFDAISDGIIIHAVDADGETGCIAQVNQAACRLLGMSEAELLRQNPREFGMCLLDRTAEKRLLPSPRVQEKELRRGDGSTFLAEYTCYCNRRPSDTPPFLVIRDITEKQKIEQEQKLTQQMLIQQSKMAELGNMIGAIAHQWQQPLNAISLLVSDLPEMYQHGELDGEELSDVAQSVMRQVHFMTQTVEDFRNFYKPSLQRELFEVESVVRGVLKLLEKQFAIDSITVRLTCAAGLTVFGYPREFAQVMLNILNNARDVFCERKVRHALIQIAIQLVDSRVACVAIEDNGGGIPADLLPERLFEPFNSTKGARGTGIGLSMARMILEKMGGAIAAYNQDAGARFELHLPLSTQEASVSAFGSSLGA